MKTKRNIKKKELVADLRQSRADSVNEFLAIFSDKGKKRAQIVLENFPSKFFLQEELDTLQKELSCIPVNRLRVFPHPHKRKSEKYQVATNLFRKTLYPYAVQLIEGDVPAELLKKGKSPSRLVCA